MFMYQIYMFDRYNCIKLFCPLKTLVKMLQNFNVCIAYNGAQKHERCIQFYSNFKSIFCRQMLMCLKMDVMLVWVKYKFVEIKRFE